jgi:hypothetical protein
MNKTVLLMRAALLSLVSILSIASIAAAAPPPASKTSPCDQKLISAQDAAGILRAPITSTLPAAGDPQTCIFKTSDYTSIAVSLRPGMGQQTVDSWATGKQGFAARALPGVGDKAVWVPDVQKVYATKGNLLCVADAKATFQGLYDPSLEVLAKKLGALCVKILAGAKAP